MFNTREYRNHKIVHVIFTCVTLVCFCVYMLKEVALFDGKIKQCTASSACLVSLSDWLEFVHGIHFSENCVHSILCVLNGLIVS